MPLVDLLAAGEAFDDLIFLSLPRLPHPGEEVKTSAFVQTIGGGAVITAVAAARLGLRCRLVSALSAAAASRLRRERVAVVNLRKPHEPHAISAALSTAGNRSFVTFNGVNDALEPRLLRALGRAQGRHVHFAFYPKRCARWLPVVARVRRRGVTTSWDFGWNEGLLGDRGFADLVGALDFVFMNDQEAVLYARRRRLADAAEHWKRAARTAIIKLGPRGSRWVSPTMDFHVAAPRVRAVDTTGAGDAFNAGFIYALVRGMPARACLRTGNQVGALSTRSAGGLDALPQHDELERAARRGAQG